MKNENENKIREAEERGDEVSREKLNILNQQLQDVDQFTRDLNNSFENLRKKSEMLNDNERMRWARQRAAQLAAQGYLTSEQVAQVANYSLGDYNKELEHTILEAEKAIDEMKMQIVQKRQDALAAVRNNMMLNQNDKLAQSNYISEKYDKLIQHIQNQRQEVYKHKTSHIQNNLGMNIQNQLGVKSIVQQNEANNVVDDRNKIRAYNDQVYRQKYILSQISDANLHPYAQRMINYLISQGKFIKE